MKQESIYCYHGSPGLPEEFLELEKLLPNSKITKISRYGDDSEGSNKMARYDEDAILLGYSWGAVDAFMDASNNIDHVKAVILLSPYLFPINKSTWLTEAIIKIPILSDIVLTVVGKKVINKMLKETSAPQEVPEQYLQVANNLAKPMVLKKAILEKQIDHTKLIDAANRLAGHNIPIAILWGSEDTLSLPSEQIEPVRRIINIRLEESLPSAGHAIIWTHPKEVATFIIKFVNIVIKE